MQKNPPTDPLRERAHHLGLWGVITHWDEFAEAEWLPRLLTIEEEERQRRSLERRIRNARIGRFKPMADFDWDWPTKIDRALVDELFTLEFLHEGANAVIVGPNGVGKSMIAQNLAYQALLRGHTVRFTSASEMLNDLAAQDSATVLRNRIARYCRPTLLAIDEVGYLSYDHRHADLLFEIVTRRYQEGNKPVVITTNKPFAEWGEVFPHAACVVTLVDRLIHKSEIVQVEGESYRLKEAKERAARKRGKKATKAKPGTRTGKS